MSNTIRIKRRATGGGAGAPSTLANAELAFNEQTNILYYGTGTGGAGGSATSIIPIAGDGAFADLTTAQTIAGAKTFSTTIIGSVDGNAGTATTLATGRTIAITGDLDYTSPSFNGSGNVTAAGTLATVNSNVGTHTKITINAKGLATAGSQASLSDLSAPTGNIGFATYQITGLGDPTNAQDAATKNYVDSVAQGLNVKAAVLATTTGNITLSGLATQANGDWASGLTVGDRILVKNQTLSQNNGIYAAASSAWTRTADANTWDELISAFTFVSTGTTLADTGWVCTIDAGGTLGTTAITWTQFSSAGAYTAGTGLDLTGNQFSLLNPVAVNLGGTGVTTSTGTGDNVLSNSPTLITPALGTPSALVLTNATGLPLTTGVTGTLTVPNGGTGAVTLTGYVIGNGASAMTASATIPTSDITGLDNITIDGGTY